MYRPQTHKRNDQRNSSPQQTHCLPKIYSLANKSHLILEIAPLLFSELIFFCFWFAVWTVKHRQWCQISIVWELLPSAIEIDMTFDFFAQHFCGFINLSNMFGTLLPLCFLWSRPIGLAYKFMESTFSHSWSLSSLFFSSSINDFWNAAFNLSANPHKVWERRRASWWQDTKWFLLSWTYQRSWKQRKRKRKREVINIYFNCLTIQKTQTTNFSCERHTTLTRWIYCVCSKENLLIYLVSFCSGNHSLLYTIHFFLSTMLFGRWCLYVHV